jgi:hypothetical protein
MTCDVQTVLRRRVSGLSNQETGSPEYQVWVDDNEHYIDKSARYSAGIFQDCASATARCKQIVDQFLLSSYREGMTAKHLMQTYQFYGEDPWVSSADDNCKFSAWAYAAERCMEICGAVTEEAKE